jgi:hypothetical protein
MSDINNEFMVGIVTSASSHGANVFLTVEFDAVTQTVLQLSAQDFLDLFGQKVTVNGSIDLSKLVHLWVRFTKVPGDDGFSLTVDSVFERALNVFEYLNGQRVTFDTKDSVENGKPTE